MTVTVSGESVEQILAQIDQKPAIRVDRMGGGWRVRLDLPNPQRPYQLFIKGEAPFDAAEDRILYYKLREKGRLDTTANTLTAAENLVNDAVRAYERMVEMLEIEAAKVNE